jgi:hypothetical protein
MLTYLLRAQKMHFVRVNPGDVQRVSAYALIIIYKQHYSSPEHG